MEVKSFSRIPFGQLTIIAMENCRELGEKINEHLVERRNTDWSEQHQHFYLDEIKDSYLVPVNNIRFSNGEGKAVLNETIRGKDIYIISDVGNYSCTYQMFGHTTHMGPDEHFQDIKRTISAIGGKDRRTTIIMPLLYAGRQHKRRSRESLDCAMALQELERLDVENIITFDAHDPRVQNAVPLIDFQTIHPTYDIIKAIYYNENHLISDKENTIIISPDTGAMDRAIYYGSVLGIDVGMFYKRRDYTKIVNGKNPILQHEYMGSDVEGKNVIIVDDMAASGESIIDIAKELKRRKAANVYAAVTFGLFTEGVEEFNKCYEQGLIQRFFSTNLTYIPDVVRNAEWFVEVDLSKLIATLIDRLNHDESISSLLTATEKIKELLEK
ncbi:MAG TPA: phosphoribosylpyrophosphate synthetase [Clostridiales bacterium]|nr:ribose-phosphate pyrophosphokinase [Clostridia bacterium]HCS74265.1 phosphoribosylpyrophosphate synthetase [Clostridiales bacterium]